MPVAGRAAMRFLTLLLVAAMWSLAAPASGRAQDMASIVVDADTGEILSSVQPTRRWFPASTTKVMTAYLTFVAIENGTLSLDEVLTVSDNAANQPETSIGLRPGEKITVEEAIEALIVRSANDAATLLAERIAGSEDRFAAMMSLKARAIGMTRTVFRNASGLPDDKQVTTAHDMAVLAQTILKEFPEYYHFFDVRTVTRDGQQLGTYNGFLGSFPGADGLKTGFTCGSGYNLVASAEQDGRRLIGVVFGAGNGGARTAEMIRIMGEGFAADAPAEAFTLANLPNATEGAEGEGPPFRLPPSECELGASVAADGPLSNVLPGWAIVFGAYLAKEEAEAVLEKSRALLDGVLSKGRPAIVPRQTEGVSRYAALLVGLEQQDAQVACKHLWSVNAYCLALNPETLNNPQALWR